MCCSWDLIQEGTRTYKDMDRLVAYENGLNTLICLFVLLIFSSYGAAYDPFDPTGNITLRWDIISWTPDGYVARVNIHNYQFYRHIPSPGWSLSWTWARKEVIWSMMGAEAISQGDCSGFKGLQVPQSCQRKPTVVDLLPGVPYQEQVGNCCKAGVVSAWGQNPSSSVSTFQLSVGAAGTSNRTVRLPRNFTLLGPGPGYTCSRAAIVPPTLFSSSDRRRTTQAFMTWNVTCIYSQFLARKYPSCCVSLSAFYNDTVIPCPSCACGCQDRNKCLQSDSETPGMVGVNDNTPLLQCTHHMCPVRVHWHLQLNYKEYWRVKLTITNLNHLNYSDWNLVVQHPNLNKVTQVYSFNYKPLIPYESINDTGMFYGMKFVNDFLLQAGYVQSEMILGKDKNMFTLEEGWAFPRKIYFNGDECQMPLPDVYPYLPKAAHEAAFSYTALILSLIFLVIAMSFGFYFRFCNIPPTIYEIKTT